MNFLHDILLREFPHVRLRFAADSVWYWIVWRLLGGTRGTVTAGAKYIYFESEEQYMYMEGARLMEVLAHEYMHFCQRAHDPWFFMVRRCLRPMLVWLCVVLALVFWNLWFALFALIFSRPAYRVFVARQEFDAYRMAVLVRVCLANDSRVLPASWYDLFMPTDASLQTIVDDLFSSTYGMQWTSKAMRGGYVHKLRQWRAECLENYFQTRLAYEFKNKYITPTVLFRNKTLEEPYAHVLTYFVTNRAAAHE